MLYRLPPCDLERWYSQFGFGARYNLSGSAAPSLTTMDLLHYAGPDAIAAYLELNLNYVPVDGTLRLRTTIAQQYATLTPEQIQVTTGAAEALLLLFTVLLHPGDAVVVQFPIYPSIYGLAEARGAEVRRWPILPNGQIDLDHLHMLLEQGKVRAIVLNHPHGPTGLLLTPSELMAIAQLAADYNATLIVDEVYRGIQFTDELTAPAADLGPHIVSIGDVAKPYGLGGLRIGWLATADTQVLDRCAEVRDYTTLCSTAPGEFLAAIALEHRTGILARQLAVAQQNRRLFSVAMTDHEWLDWSLPDGGFTIFPRSQLRRSTATTCHELYERYSVLVLPGEVFTMPGYLRLGFGVDPDQFAAGLERLLAYAAHVDRELPHAS